MRSSSWCLAAEWASLALACLQAQCPLPRSSSPSWSTSTCSRAHPKSAPRLSPCSNGCQSARCISTWRSWPTRCPSPWRCSSPALVHSFTCMQLATCTAIQSSPSSSCISTCSCSPCSCWCLAKTCWSPSLGGRAWAHARTSSSPSGTHAIARQ
ncbi:unannotated protein [freshwater metagenome]|uniref:Unannotated protein n=1 Tax=freshwater metagenome TaxID=449393 RepID=A0A6J6QUA4_9ZZZZ